VLALAPGARLIFDGDVVEVLALDGIWVTLRNVRTEAMASVGLTALICSAWSLVEPAEPPVSAGAALTGLTVAQRRQVQERAEHVREVLTGFRSGRDKGRTGGAGRA
jgi:hypothetical protein